MRWMLILATAVALAGCAPGATLAPAPQTTAPHPTPPTTAHPAGSDTPALPPAEAARAFVEVMTRVEPMAEAACRDLARAGTNCAFDIRVDPRPEMEPNAFQTVDETGRPLVIFTLSLIADARNADELAFVLGHEAAHHVLGHIPRRQETAARGAMLGAVYGTVTGADAATMKQLQEMGAQIGARRYSKSFELEADALGAEIAWRAGYDPVRGTGFFDRLPDPGDAFLGSHPPNGQRRAQVAEVVTRLSRLSAAQ